MKKLLLILFLTALTLPSWAQTTKVACIGNSITYGAGIENREKNSYPVQLQYFLGGSYEVQNFGISARTLLRSGDYPYVETEQYQQSLDWNPDIVLIKLGTNDTKPHNHSLLSANYKKEFSELIDTYRTLPSHPRVILLTPVRCYLPDEVFSTQDYEQIIIPALEELAYEKGIEVINLYTLFSPEHEEYLFPDRLHPSSIGAGMMAQKIGEYVTAPREEYRPVEKLPASAEAFNYHGYKGYAFTLDSIPCKLVEPKQTAEGRPWIWRARFWGHEPQTDIALLEQGFHVVYCDVADLYGSPIAVARWNDFYAKIAQPLGLASKAALEGMSRGGLIAYNWAAANPDKVACIYADAPVMDFKSWPMGQGASEGSAEDTQKLLAAYGFEDTAQALKWRENPTDHAATLVNAGIPILHVVGDADTVVPVAENTSPFQEQVKTLGGTIHVIHKPGIGHHPHSLAAPAPIVRFILQNTGHLPNPCTHPVPGNEYRSGAGWKQSNDWHAVSEEISQILTEGPQLDLLLIGNSITQGFGGSRQTVTYKPGKVVADTLFRNLKWESAGISGDRTQHILWRLAHGDYAAANPRNVVLTIGINNLTAGDTPEQVAKGITAAAKLAAKIFPDAAILLLGPLPAGATSNDPIRRLCESTHTLLTKEQMPEGVTYLNPTAWFIGSDGNQRPNLYADDQLHLDTPGYRAWCGYLLQHLK